MLEACFDLIVPIIVASIVNKGIAEGDRRYIITRFAMLLGMAVFGLACSFVAQYFAAKASVGTATGLRRQLLEKFKVLALRSSTNRHVNSHNKNDKRRKSGSERCKHVFKTVPSQPVYRIRCNDYGIHHKC